MTDNHASAEIEALKQEIERLQQENVQAHSRISVLKVMQEVARSLNSELNLEPLLKMILASAVRVMDASAGALLLLDRENDELVFELIEGGSGQALEKTRMPADKGIAGWVVSHGQPLIVDDVDRDARHYRAISEGFGYATHSILCVPMKARKDVIGALQVLNKSGGMYFTVADQELLTAFAAQSAVAIENARLYQSLREEQDRILATEEDIRHRLARDLHDGPAQLLAAIIMSANFIKNAFARDRLEIARNELDEMLPVAEKALYQVRTLLFDLRPVILETRGFIPALESYVQNLRKSEDLNVILKVDGDLGRLCHKATIAIFSVIQEAINNAKKHAFASQVEIRVTPTDDDYLSVVVHDDGVGFDVQAVEGYYDERGSLGMLNMRERAEMVEGVLSIHSKPGQGTTVTLKLPLSPNLESQNETC